MWKSYLVLVLLTMGAACQSVKEGETPEPLDPRPMLEQLQGKWVSDSDPNSFWEITEDGAVVNHFSDGRISTNGIFYEYIKDPLGRSYISCSNRVAGFAPHSIFSSKRSSALYLEKKCSYKYRLS